MNLKELKVNVRSGKTDTINTLYSNRVFDIRWNGRLEIKEGTNEWKFASKQRLLVDFGVGGVALPSAGSALDFLD